MAELMLTRMPRPTRITPDHTEIPVLFAVKWDSLAPNCRRKSPKRLTAKPTPIRASPVRIQARKVLSAAKYTLGSCSMGFSMRNCNWMDLRCAGAAAAIVAPVFEDVEDILCES